MTPQEYERKLQAMLGAMLDVVSDRGWCPESWQTIVRLSPDFRIIGHDCGNRCECGCGNCDCGNDDDEITVSITSTPALLPESLFTAAGYADYVKANQPDYDVMLRELRGRILSLIGTYDDSITAGEANAVLAAGGLATVSVRTRWEINGWEQYFTTDSDDPGEARQLLRDAWMAFTRILGEVTDVNDEEISPYGLDVDPADDDNLPAIIPAGDLVPLL